MRGWLLALLLLLAGCTSSSSEPNAAEPNAAADPPTGTQPSGTQADESNDPAAESGDQAEAEPADVEPLVIDPIRVDLPLVPAIVLPDLSALDETGDLVAEQLGDLAAPESGLDIVGASCAAEDGELQYEGGEAGMSFFDIDPDGSGVVTQLDDGVSTVEVNADGSGRFSRVGDGTLSIEVEADGSGRYSRVGDGTVTIETDADGFGSYSSTGDGTLNIEIEAPGVGSLSSTGGGNVTDLIVAADGSGEFSTVGNGTHRIIGGSDGGFEYRRTGDSVVTLIVNADGSGEFRQVAEGIVAIEVDSDGNGTYEAQGTTEEFSTDIGILDPEYLIVGPLPEFVVADRFPPLDRLAPLAPPCVIVIRLNSEVLFDFDKSELRPGAGPVLDEVATVVESSGRSIEIHGHTDAIGTDEYNLDLSDRRAGSVEAALMERGVSQIDNVEGFGETRPVAPNENADGSDNPAGRQLNRRVEIILLAP